MDAADQPTLQARLDTDTNQVEVTVSADGSVYESATLDLETLLATEQYLGTFERPALTLLSLWERNSGAVEEEDSVDGLTDAEVAADGA